MPGPPNSSHRLPTWRGKHDLAEDFLATHTVRRGLFRFRSGAPRSLCGTCTVLVQAASCLRRLRTGPRRRLQYDRPQPKNRGKIGLTSTPVCGKNRAHAGNSWEKPWENDLNFFPFSQCLRTLVRNLNLFLVERGTGFEPATSTLGTRRHQSTTVKGYPPECPSQVERSSVVYMRQCPSVGKSWECGK
jgi:hypothetical protein